MSKHDASPIAAVRRADLGSCIAPGRRLPLLPPVSPTADRLERVRTRLDILIREVRASALHSRRDKRHVDEAIDIGNDLRTALAESEHFVPSCPPLAEMTSPDGGWRGVW